MTKYHLPEHILVKKTDELTSIIRDKLMEKPLSNGEYHGIINAHLYGQHVPQIIPHAYRAGYRISVKIGAREVHGIRDHYYLTAQTPHTHDFAKDVSKFEECKAFIKDNILAQSKDVSVDELHVIIKNVLCAEYNLPRKSIKILDPSIRMHTELVKELKYQNTTRK